MQTCARACWRDVQIVRCRQCSSCCRRQPPLRGCWCWSEPASGRPGQRIALEPLRCPPCPKPAGNGSACLTHVPQPGQKANGYALRGSEGSMCMLSGTRCSATCPRLTGPRPCIVGAPLGRRSMRPAGTTCLRNVLETCRRLQSPKGGDPEPLTIPMHPPTRLQASLLALSSKRSRDVPYNLG